MHFIHGRFINFWSPLLIPKKTGIILLRHHYSALINCKIAEWEKLQWADIFFSLLFVVVVVGCFSFFFVLFFQREFVQNLSVFGFKFSLIIVIVGVCSSNSLARRWGTRNLIYILACILLWLLLTLLTLLNPTSSL